ncbi:MAG TPA: phosphoenolpyruvate synthase [Solirubrobacteraceae bacterium]|nr:phosphoenolpyruvate synthase [Solirubrobacteraceae bacterium]
MSTSLTEPVAPTVTEPIRRFSELRKGDVDYAGGKGANLGELTSAGLPIPPGFVIGAPAYAAFCQEAGLRKRLAELLDNVDVEDTAALSQAAEQARALFDEAVMPDWLEHAIREAYSELSGSAGAVPVAVRSSATAEDTAAASFAGMNETFLNIIDADAVIDAVRHCWRSLFGARTVYYRGSKDLSQADMDIAVVVQRQIQSTRAGVMFTANPATGDRNQLVIEGSFGLGEAVVSGSVSPDRYLVDKAAVSIRSREVHHKELTIVSIPGGGTITRDLSEEEALTPVLTDEEVLTLAKLGRDIEAHYGSPQDTEWAFDPDGAVWMLQSRPITTLLGTVTAPTGATTGTVLLRGLGGAPGSASGAVRVLSTLADAARLGDGDILVTHMTTPDWVPLMRRAAAIATDSGGMTCHAAIVSRELGIPCVVGTGDATKKLRDGEIVTIDATHGVVVEGAQAPTHAPASAPAGALAGPARAVTATKLLVNMSEPSQAERAAALDVDGVGLLRAELMVLEALGGDHPRTLLQEDRGDEFVTKMADGLSTFADAFAPRPITYRTIDFRTNEFRGLRGGEQFEPEEANPMIGYRGALRYTREPEVFGLELAALRRVWDEGHTNLHVMLPFVRTTVELRRCRDLIAESGLLERPGFELWVMAEVPSVLFNLADYAELGVTGISIGSNDLTQLLLGADRDNEVLAETFDERDPAVTRYLRQLIPTARKLGLQTSICGQAPSVHPEYAELLVRAGIDCVSVNTDVVDRTRALLASAEQRVLLDAARDRGSRR